MSCECTSAFLSPMLADATNDVICAPKNFVSVTRVRDPDTEQAKPRRTAAACDKAYQGDGQIALRVFLFTFLHLLQSVGCVAAPRPTSQHNGSTVAGARRVAPRAP